MFDKPARRVGLPSGRRGAAVADSQTEPVSASSRPAVPWAWVWIPLLLSAAIGVVGWRAESTARSLALVDRDVTALELSFDALKRARAAQQPLRLPDPTP